MDEPPPADATGAAAAPLRRTFVLHFFVADGCVRIDEELGHNSGREFERGGVATFLRKGGSPRTTTRRAEASTYRPNRWLGRSGDLDDGDVRYVGLDDLAVGATVGVHGQSMRVVGCDEPTRATRARGGARLTTTTSCRARALAAAAPAPRRRRALPTTAPTPAAAPPAPRRRARPRHAPPRRRRAPRRRVGGGASSWGRRPGTGRAATLPSDTLRFRAVRRRRRRRAAARPPLHAGLRRRRRRRLGARARVRGHAAASW